MNLLYECVECGHQEPLESKDGRKCPLCNGYFNPIGYL